MADYVPIICDDDRSFTSQASATITGGQVLAVSGSGTVAPAGANSLAVVGVAAQDAASTAYLTVYAGGIQLLTASGTVTAGDIVVAGAAGTVATLAAVTTPTAADVTNTRATLGVALTTATTGNPVRVLWKI